VVAGTGLVGGDSVRVVSEAGTLGSVDGVSGTGTGPEPVLLAWAFVAV